MVSDNESEFPGLFFVWPANKNERERDWWFFAQTKSQI